jgi:hypothetical protein
MSYRTRKRKRITKIAVARAKREHGEVMSWRYYLTIVKKAARCCGCGKHLRVGDEMVYRRNGHVTLCVPCADGDPLVDYRTSTRWERRRGSRRQAK